MHLPTFKQKWSKKNGRRKLTSISKIDSTLQHETIWFKLEELTSSVKVKVGDTHGKITGDQFGRDSEIYYFQNNMKAGFLLQ